jgi:integrase
MTEDKPRRPKGSGSIYTRKDGRVVGEYEANGKKRYVYGKTKKEVASKLAKAIADRDARLVYDSGKLTVEAYLDKWLDTIRDTLRNRTVQRHEQIVRLHLKPTLGKVKLDKLNALQLQALYRQKLDLGLSPRTVQIIHATIYKALKQAVRWQLILLNVAEAANPPKAPKAEINSLTLAQVKTLLNAARGDRFEALYILAMTTGMRSGELLGLQWRSECP